MQMRHKNNCGLLTELSPHTFILSFAILNALSFMLPPSQLQLCILIGICFNFVFVVPTFAFLFATTTYLFICVCLFLFCRFHRIFANLSHDAAVRPDEFTSHRDYTNESISYSSGCVTDNEAVRGSVRSEMRWDVVGGGNFGCCYCRCCHCCHYR